MKKQIKLEIEIPEGIDVEVKGSKIEISKGDAKLSRNLQKKVDKRENKIIIEEKLAGKRERKIMGTIRAHIKNMIKGLEEPYEYKLKICSVHFPMNVSIENKKLIVKNFLGETKPRELKLRDNVEVNINGDVIEVKSIDKELAGQTAADIEKTTRINNKDRRIFQDGIYITEKPGRKI